jgi:hypothetical protein
VEDAPPLFRGGVDSSPGRGEAGVEHAGSKLPVEHAAGQRRGAEGAGIEAAGGEEGELRRRWLLMMTMTAIIMTS